MGSYDTVFVIVFAFGQQRDRTQPLAGPSNEELATAATEIYMEEAVKGTATHIASQWEVIAANQRFSKFARTHLSEFSTDTHYLTTRQVLESGVEAALTAKADRLVLVAHPLHLFFIKLLIKSGAWKTGGLPVDHQYDKLMRAVPYDRSPGNIQWWTKGPLRFITYLARAAATRQHGR